MILPAMGVISDIIPVFSRKTIFRIQGHRFFKHCHCDGGFLCLGAPHVRQRAERFRVNPLLLSHLFGRCSKRHQGLQLGGHLYKGSIELEPPLLFALTFIFLFSIGGLTGLIPGSTGGECPSPRYVLGRWPFPLHHLRRHGIRVFRQAIHYWFPKMFGKMFDRGSVVSSHGFFSLWGSIPSISRC